MNFGLAAIASSRIFLFVCLLLVSYTACIIAARYVRRKGGVLAEPLSAFTFLVLPTAFVLAVLVMSGELKDGSRSVKILKTLIGIEVIWVLLSLLKSSYIWRAAGSGERPKIPVLFLDVTRLALVLLGSAFVVAAVWNRDLTQFLTTLGIGSIVLGLALQETLGNFFAGIALFFENPFKVGDWIRVGDRQGEVVEVNWRSVRVRDFNENMIIIPNAVLGRERIENYSRPTKVCGITAQVGFSYDNAPNKVKRVLLEVLDGCPQVLRHPRPVIHTKDFAASAVTYELKYFIDDYSRLPLIEEDIKTKIWYAARRHGLTIPYPTQVVYETAVPYKPEVIDPQAFQQMLAKVPIFEPLLPEELSLLAREMELVEYGDQERIVEQGARGDSMLILRSGRALVSVKDKNGAERQVKELGPGDFFGEMALLTGESRTATVTAEGDLSAIAVYKEALNELFSRRPALLSVIAGIAAQRRSHLEVIRTAVSNDGARPEQRDGAGLLLAKIRSFFGISTTL
jgi:small-conductance mechanosensitive channel/CRP-like cAMP-binding protein